MLKRTGISYLIVFILLLAHPSLAAESSLEYIYRFENPRFDISFVEIKLHNSGDGEMRYKKRDEDEEIKLELKLKPATIQRLADHYNELKFLESSETYQTDKPLPNMGTITLGLKADGREREASFNYSTNRAAMRLVELYRAIENQQRRLVDMRLARQFTPLDLPRQLKLLEADIKKDKIAEPEAMLPLLTEITLDDSLPLIARNAAEKLAKQIKK
jgi:hypothetical protein